MTSTQSAVIRNRAAAMVAMVFCAFEALPQSLTTFSKSALHGRDPLLIFGFIASIFITTSIAMRSSFVGDRIVFGAAAVAFFLRLITNLVSPSGSAASVISVFVSLAWSIGAVGALVVLISVSRRRAGS